MPDYQRGYAWTRAQLEDFWRDLQVLAAGQEHFMGMLVVKARTGAEAECELIDGQQRLTTTVLLMDALVALRARGGAEGGRQAAALEERIRSGGLDRLRLNADSRSFFQEILAQEEPSADPNRSQQTSRERPPSSVRPCARSGRTRRRSVAA